MQNRRDFLKTATLAAIGSGLGIHNVFAGKSGPCKQGGCRAAGRCALK